MARFVLVHGAWHGGWCFVDLARELEARGHEVFAPDLPCDQVGLTPADYAKAVGSHPDAVVLGHSRGAQTLPLVEARVRVYLSGLLPVENVYSECFAPGFGGFLRDELDRSYWPDADTAALRMYADCTREQSDWAFAQLRPQAQFELTVAPFRENDVIVVTSRDALIDPAWQRRTAREHGVRAVELDAGHFSFMTQPAEVATLLESLA
jgi:pimeloyl-ACP methyl ester carboxylesterase